MEQLNIIIKYLAKNYLTVKFNLYLDKR